MSTLTLNLNSVVQLSDDQFLRLCAQNPDVQLERTATGELIIMPPTGGETGKRSSDLTTELNLWNRRTQLGVTFDSSTGFMLPNGAIRSPGAFAEVDALDSRYALRAHSVRRGNDGSVIPMTAKPTLKSMTVIPGKRSATRNPGRGLCFPAEVDALDSCLRRNDGSGML